MFGFGESQDSYQQVQNDQPDNEGKFSHELLAGGASFAAFKVFEDRQRAEGKPVSHAFAKELLAGIVGGEVDKLVETKGLDYIDREKAKRQAEQNVQEMYDAHYVQGHGADQYDPNQYDAPQEINNYNY